MFRTHGIKENLSVDAIRKIPNRIRGAFGQLKLRLPQLHWPQLRRAKIEPDFGLKPGDKIRTIDEYHASFTTFKPFSGTVLYIKDGLATVVEDSGKRHSLSCYWLTNGNPKYGD